MNLLQKSALSLLFITPTAAQTTFGGNPQHTAVYTPAAQTMNSIHWTTSIDLSNTGNFAHYGAPVITPGNTILVPVKTGATGGFEIQAFNAATGGAPLYTLSTDYSQPSHNWILPYQPVLAGTRLYYPGAGGTLYYIDNADSPAHSAPTQEVFYSTLATYQGNAAGFNSSVFINTPLTTDSSGNVFFGFRVNGTAPAPLSTSQSGFARIAPNGAATYVLAGAAASDSNIGYDSHNSGPALSNDQSTVYVAVKSPNTETYGYLLGLDATTLATKYKVFLKDPRSNNLNNATLLDDSTASPMVGPDGDVYFGIYGDPANGSRGFMLHFSGDLSKEKAPGGFGWDNTAAIVPATMVPSYTGPSSYLLFTKYNNYADGGSDSGDGVNRVALLDPNATQVDAHTSSNGMLVMREVLTVIGPTADANNRTSSNPFAVREWCVNTAAVNPATRSIFVPSEDGRFYQWNLVLNSLSQFVNLSPGLGEPYIPTLIGPDGSIFTLNGGLLSAVGSVTGVAVALNSSSPDMRNAVAGQSLTFTVSVANTGNSGATPTGTVTLQDTTYSVPSQGALKTTTTTLASLPLSNGTATYSTSALTGDKHFITASYSGDTNFKPATAGLVQFVHPYGSVTSLASSPNPSGAGQSVTFTANVTPAPGGSGTPTGMVTFQEGNNVMAQVPLNSSGAASFSTSSLALGSHTFTATYASDTNFAASSGSKTQTVQSSTTPTSTSLTFSPSQAVYGQPVTFTSTTTSGGGVPSGSVTFSEGSTVWAAGVPVDGSGHATFTGAAFPAGNHTLTATFAGNSGWGSSSGVSQQLSVKTASTSTSVTSSLNPSVYSQAVTFTAVVKATAPSSGVPVGTVTFKNGGQTLATVTLDGTGAAAVTTSALPAGSPSITGDYNGNANYSHSNSQNLNQNVTAEGTKVSVASSLNPSGAGHPVTFTATVAPVAPGTAMPTGQITFQDGGKNLGSANLTNGQATITISNLAKGTHPITVQYQGNQTFQKGTSPTLEQAVN